MKLLMLGDLSYDFEHVADDIKAIGGFIRDSKASVILNLEGALTDGSSKEIRKRGKHLRQKGAVEATLKELNTIGVTLANNHMMDFGKEGLSDTLVALEEAKIKYAGAGMMLKDALKPMIIVDGDKKIAIFNFGWDAEETVYAGKKSPGCAPRKNDVVLKTVVDYSHNNPLHSIIVTLHWGFEYNLYPQPYDIDLAHRLCNIKNVKAVIGHHSHCPQPVEIYKGKPIYYSLGNFYFASRRIKYTRRIFDFTPKDMSDYGLGVMIDTDNWESEAIVHYYDKNTDRTTVIDSDVLPVKMPEIDYRSEEYSKLAAKHALKGNPILGTDEQESNRIIFKYNTARNMMKYAGGIVSFMKRTPAGNATLKYGRRIVGIK